MEKIKNNKIKFLGIFLIMALMLSFVSMPVSANKLASEAKSQAGNVLIEQLFSGAETLLNKVFGLNPIVHGVLAGAFSAINTFSQLSKVEIDFALDRDKVNISTDKIDYFEPYDNYLLDNRIDQKIVKNNMLLTDENILDARFINTKNLSEIDDGKNSPLFRLAEKTKLVTLLDSNNQPKDIQKREILFEDTNKTIENAYEYRNFVIRYPKSTYTGKVDYELDFEDIWGGYSMLIPFFTGASQIKISKYLDGSNKKLLNKIDENKKQEVVLEPFKLIFNSYVRDDITGIELDQVNCIAEDGTTLLGSTGTEALPRIALDWTYSIDNAETISGMSVSRKNWCDADLTGQKDKQSIYCDATQFSIEVLNKLKDIETFVQNNKGSFTCPTPGITQSLISENNNLGITQLNSNYEASFVTVDYTLKGSFNSSDKNAATPKYGDLNIIVFKDNVLQTSKLITINVIDFTNKKFSGSEKFNVGLILDDETKFKVQAILTLIEPYKSLEVTTADNILINEFTPNSDLCNLEKTSQNINLYSKNNKIDTSLVEFRSYLMKDGYSNDFKADFDRYYRFTITAAPDYYKDSYYKYFTTDNLIFKSSFDSEPGRLMLQGPGRYNVLLKVTFDDEWNLFNKTTGEVSGKVEVILTRELAPERDSPLYYMPFNGIVGIDSENARQGYGVDFTGDIVTISQLQTNEYLRTEPFTQSNTVNTISVKEYGKEATDFSFINNSSTRGMLLDISLSSTKTNPRLVFVPSRATPVVLKVSNQANNAYSFYKLDIGAPQALGGSPASTPGSLVPWTGVGNCLDFTGISVQEVYLYRPDIAALSSRLAPTTSSQGVSYGVEWENRNITRRGDVYLRTVFYTPSNFKSGNGVSVLYQDAYDDDALFYTREKNGSKTVELKNILGNDIKFVSEIFALVKDKKACIDYSANNLKVYYNPIAVSEPLFSNDLSSDSQNSWINARGACIVN